MNVLGLSVERSWSTAEQLELFEHSA